MGAVENELDLTGQLLCGFAQENIELDELLGEYHQLLLDSEQQRLELEREREELAAKLAQSESLVRELTQLAELLMGSLKGAMGRDKEFNSTVKGYQTVVRTYEYSLEMQMRLLAILKRTNGAKNMKELNDLIEEVLSQQFPDQAWAVEVAEGSGPYFGVYSRKADLKSDRAKLSKYVVDTPDGKVTFYHELEIADELAFHLEVVSQIVCSAAKRCRESVSDRLTSLWDAVYLDRQLERELSRAERHQHPLAVMLFDIDHFKKVNDQHGHQAGDLVLKELAEIVDQHHRDEDSAGRKGGDEFGIVLPETDRATAKGIAARLRQEVEEHVFLDGKGKRTLRLTISIGVAYWTPDIEGCNHYDLLKMADKGLYAAKGRGRNGISLRKARPGAAHGQTLTLF